MHRQKGYKTIQKNINHAAAILYKTTVCTIETDENNQFSRVFFNTGGWTTRSTCKAINGFLADQGIQNWRVCIRKGAMHAKCNTSFITPFNGDEHIIHILK